VKATSGSVASVSYSRLALFGLANRRESGLEADLGVGESMFDAAEDRGHDALDVLVGRRRGRMERS